MHEDEGFSLASRWLSPAWGDVSLSNLLIFTQCSYKHDVALLNTCHGILHVLDIVGSSINCIWHVLVLQQRVYI